MGSVSFTETYKSRAFGFLQHVKFEHLAAGVTAGLTSTLALHPLDVVKIRFAVNDGRTTKVPMYRGIFNAFQTIYRNEGVNGLYKGVTPNLAGAGASWGLYFLFYNSIKGWMRDGNVKNALGTTEHILAASQAGLMTLFLTNPLWVIKTRLCLQYSATDGNSYAGLTDAFKKIFKTEGIRGFYTGLVPGMFGVSHGVIQFVVYEKMKDRFNRYRGTPLDSKLGTEAYLLFAAVSKFIAAGTTYPYQVVRLRLQQQNASYNGVLFCISQTYRHEGWRGFYKGLGPNLLRVVPATMITFVTYENLAYILMKPK